MIHAFRDRRGSFGRSCGACIAAANRKSKPVWMVPIMTLASRSPFRQSVMFFLVKNQYKSRDREHGYGSSSLDQARYQQAIFPGGRIVVVAEEQHLIDGRADFSLRSFHQAKAKIARRELDAIKVARDFSLRRQEHNRARMGELL